MKYILICLAVLHLMMTTNAQRIVNANKIESRNGIRYVKDENMAFSGILKKYNDQNILIAQAVLKDGKFSGEEICYYSSGKKKSLKYYENDIPINEYKVWNEDGSLSFEGFFKGHLLYKIRKTFTGTIKSKFLNGQIHEQLKFKKGYREGAWTVWNGEGQIIGESNFAFYDQQKHNRLKRISGLDSLQFLDGKYYHKNSHKLFSGKLVNYHVNGEIETAYTLKQGEKTGKIMLYYDSGDKRVLSYEDKNHINFGRQQVWNEGGTVVFKGTWINGKLYEHRYKEPFTGRILQHYRYGHLCEESQFKNGHWHGIQKRWNRNQELLSECIFENNKIVDCTVLSKVSLR